MKTVYTTNPWIPTEWIRAHAFQPCGLSLSGFTSRRGSKAQGVCAFAEACLDFVRAHPEDLFVFDSSCDQLRRAFDAIVGPQTFLFNVPMVRSSPLAIRRFRVELERLSRWLLRHGGSVPDPVEIIQCLRHRKDSDIFLRSLTQRCSARHYAEALVTGQTCREAHLPEDPNPPSAQAIALALVGPHLPQAQWRLLDEIERLGARVALFANAGGERILADEVAESAVSSAADFAEFLAQRFVKENLDVLQRPNGPFYEWLEQELQHRAVQGILLWTYVNCDLWRAEVQTIKERCARPVCLLEEDTVDSCSPRSLGRLQAFLESLR